jgi:hypothetical protein
MIRLDSQRICSSHAAALTAATRSGDGPDAPSLHHLPSGGPDSFDHSDAYFRMAVLGAPDRLDLWIRYPAHAGCRLWTAQPFALIAPAGAPFQREAFVPRAPTTAQLAARGSGTVARTSPRAGLTSGRCGRRGLPMQRCQHAPAHTAAVRRSDLHGCGSGVGPVVLTAGDRRIVRSPQPAAADRTPAGSRRRACLNGRSGLAAWLRGIH